MTTGNDLAIRGLAAAREGRVVGFLPPRELPDLWPGDKALLLAMPLDAPPPARGA